MIIGVDSYFTNARRPEHNCQDYALHNFPYVIVSDGCSSSRHTDIGARILTHLTNDFFISHNDIDMLENYLIAKCAAFPHLLSIPDECMDATLITAYQDNLDTYIFFFGDGYMISVYENGSFEFTKLEFEGNAPFYLSYKLYEKKKKMYDDFVQDKKIKKNTHFYSDGKIDVSQQSHEPGCFLGNIFSKDLSKISMRLICTDGLSSFVNVQTGEKVPDVDVIKELIQVKSKGGEFLKRRVKRMLSDFAEKGIYNTDDIGVAGFIFTYEETNGK